MSEKKVKAKPLLCLILSVVCTFLCTTVARSATPDETKKYLDASQALRSGDFQLAKQLLDDLMKHCSDSDLLLKADERLTEAVNGLKQNSLPKTPGVYVLKKSGALVKLEKVPVASARMMKEGATSIVDALDAPEVTFIIAMGPAEVPADQIEAFFIYNPNATNVGQASWNYLEAIKPDQRRWVDLPEGTGDKVKYIFYPEWADKNASGEQIASDEIVKETLGPGMFKIIFPASYVPASARMFALRDGSGYAYPFTLHPSTYTLIKQRYLDPGIATDDAVRAIQDGMSASPDNPVMSDALTITYLRMGNWGKAAESAHNTIEMAKESGKSAGMDQFERRLGQAEARSVLDKVKKELLEAPGKEDEALTMIDQAIAKDPTLGLGDHWAAQIHFRKGQLSEASAHAKKAWDIERTSGTPQSRDYEQDYHEKRCAELIADLEANCGTESQDVAGCVKKAEEAVDHQDDLPKANFLLAGLYERAGRTKDAIKKAEKAAKKARDKAPANAPGYFDYLASLQVKNGEPGDAVDAEKDAIKAAEKAGMDATPYRGRLAEYEQAKKSK